MQEMKEIQEQINKLSDELIELGANGDREYKDFDKEIQIRRKIEALQYKLRAAEMVDLAVCRAKNGTDKYTEIYGKEAENVQANRAERMPLYKEDVASAINHRTAIEKHCGTMESIWERIATALEEMTDG